MDKVCVHPFAVRLSAREVLLELLIVDDSLLLGVNKKHFARLKAGFSDDLAFVEVEYADLTGQNKIAVRRDIIS